MFKNITYKKKNKLLLIGVVLLIIVLYNFAFKKTILAYSDCKNAENQIAIAANAPMMVAQLKKQLLRIEETIGTNETNNKSEQALLELVTNYCQSNSAVLNEFPKSTFANQGDLIIETNRFVIQGNFSTLIKLVYLLEQKEKMGQLASVHYQLKKDIITKKNALFVTIYLQKVKKT